MPTKKKTTAEAKSGPGADTRRVSSMEEFGSKVGRKIGEASNQLEHESERLIKYVNDQLVPAIRGESTGALRKAAEKLQQFADYLDDQKKRKEQS